MAPRAHRRGIIPGLLPWALLLSGSHSVHAQSNSTTSNATDLTSYVDLFIGTSGSTPGSAIAGGNGFPGASLPWGMAKVGIDTSYLGLPPNTAVDCNAGYTPLGNVTAVSMMHVSGTGGVPTYGFVSQMPLSGDLSDINLVENKTYAQNRSLGAERAEVGYFATKLLDGTGIEMTAGNHTGLVRYTFPGDGEDAHVLVDLTHVLPAFSPSSQSYSQRYVRGELSLEKGGNGQASYSGSATYSGGWPNPEASTVFFCGNFSAEGLVPTGKYVRPVGEDRVEGAGTFSFGYDPLPFGEVARPSVSSRRRVVSSAGNRMGLGGLFSWSPASNTSAAAVVEARIGISHINTSFACSYISSELPETVTFSDTVAQARQGWTDRVLSSIEVLDDGTPSSQNTTLKTMLYTALYHTALQPTDKTGENPHWTSSETEPYYDDHYTLWDTYRTLLPLYHLLFTSVYTRVLNGLVNIYKHEGFLPAGRASNFNGRVQGGTHADVVLGDAFVKSVYNVATPNVSAATGLGELGDVDWQTAYAAILQDGEVLPEPNVDSVASDGSTKEGRGALDDYLRYGWVTRNHTRSISRGLEYSLDDFSIYTVAAGLSGWNGSSAMAVDGGLEHVKTRYLERSSWWENQWNPDASTSLEKYGVIPGNFTGFAGPRDASGQFNTTDYDPLVCSGSCSWGDDIYEATVWTTSFSAAPHDMGRVIALHGGDDAFVARLDASFLPGLGTSVGSNNDAGTALFNPGNEPGFAMPFLYCYVPGMQWKTANQSRAIVDAFYGTGRDGYPGNIDAGALPSWLLFNLLGIYPVAGQAIYLLGSPRFSALRVRLFQGTPLERWLEIRAEGVSEESSYPQSVRLDGRSLDRAWVSHGELVAARELVFVMGREPGSWDVGERPWSLSTYEG